MRMHGTVTGLLLGTAIVMIGSLACAGMPLDPVDGTCCTFTGPVAHDCEAIENLGPGADLDGRCNEVHQGLSCSWDYSADTCCETAVGDGFPGSVQCP